MLQNMPEDVLLHIFSYMDYRDLLNCSLVCQRLRDTSNLDVLWKYQCFKYWLDKECPQGQTWRSHFWSLYRNWNRYVHCYAAIRTAWNKIEAFMTQHCPDIRNSLREGATDNYLDEMEEQLQKKLPIDLRCSYRIHDGQKKTLNFLGKTIKMYYGLFGYPINRYKSEAFLDIHTAITYKTLYHTQFPNAIHITACHIPVQVAELLGVTTEQQPLDVGLTQMIMLSEMHCSKAGTIFYPSTDGIFINALSFTEWLTHFSNQLERQEFLVENKQLSQLKTFPEKTTGHFTISMQTCFLPEQSTTNPPSFVQRCRIKVMMNELAPKSAACQLEALHWTKMDCDSNECENEVGHGGVFTIMEVMYPGNTFSKSFTTIYGNCMTGYLTARNLETGERIDIACPTVYTKSLPYLTTDMMSPEALE